ncbi:MAG: hypothetical protein GX161_12945 [Firmicutes bacterium]|nr:hypothetical protein [Bacillota bacterium]
MKGIAIDIDLTGETAVVVPIDTVDEAFIEFVKSEEYLDWLEEAHSGDVDFPYAEPLMINGKEYDVPIYRVRKDVFCPVGGVLEFTPEQVIAELKV